ncbi:MAG: alpha-2-macroglobulin family protein [Planctomycetia bacterium]|nr:alpha-2-macroglobulin family protein [Planctomycetia bacterium]
MTQPPRTDEQRLLVTAPVSRDLNAAIAFSRNDYAPGEEVGAQLQYWGAEGRSAAGAEVTLRAKVADQDVWSDQVRLDDFGQARALFVLPVELNGDATLTAVADLGGEQSYASAGIPLASTATEVRFYPEGGELIAGVENRVYFSVYDRANRPLDVSGEIVDDQQHVLREANTMLAGRGVFRISPQAGRTYRLHLEGVDDTNAWPSLPLVRSDRSIALSIPQAVMAAGEPIRATVYDRSGETPLVVAAYNRGRQVGQATLVTAPGKNIVQINPGPEADGVLRIAALDCSEAVPRPIAERLAYRAPSRRLNVAVQGLKSDVYLPEEPAELQAQLTDESARPVANAVLGVSVVDTDLPTPPGAPRGNLETYFRLASQLERPEDFDFVDLRLDDVKASGEALDLLLGTQGWRRIVAAPEPDMLAQQQIPIPEAAVTDAASLLLWDNLAEIQPRYEQRAAQLRSEQAQLLAVLMICGGAGLALTLILAMLWRLVASLEWSLPSLAAAAGCVAIGVMLARSGGQGAPPLAPVAFANTAAPVELAAAPKRAAAPIASDLRDESVDAPVEAKEASGGVVEKGAMSKAVAPAAPVGEDFAKDALDAATPPPSAEYSDPPPPAPVATEPMSRGAAAAPSQQSVVTEQVQQRAAEPPPADMATRFQLQRTLTPGARPLTVARYSRETSVLPETDAITRMSRSHYRLAEDETRQRREADTRETADAKSAQDRPLDEAERLSEAAIVFDDEATNTEVFFIREYAHEPPVSSDASHSTSSASLYWHPLAVTDEEGKASFAFTMGSAEAEYALRIDAQDGTGRIAATEKKLRVGYPVLMAQTLPTGLTAGDRYEVPVQLENQTENKQQVAMKLYGEATAGGAEASDTSVDLEPKERKQLYLSFQADRVAGTTMLGLEGNSAAPHNMMFNEQVSQQFAVTSDGYPVVETQSGWLEGNQEISLRIPENAVPGSLAVRFWLYPSVTADWEHAREELTTLPQANLNTQFALAQANWRLGNSTAIYTDLAALSIAPVQVGRAATDANQFQQYWSFGSLLEGVQYANKAQGRGDYGFHGGYGGGSLSRQSSGSGQRGSAYGVQNDQLMRRLGATSGALSANDFGYPGLGLAPNEVALAWSIGNSDVAQDDALRLPELKVAEEVAREQNEPIAAGVVANGLLQAGDQAAGETLLGQLATWQQSDGSVPTPRMEAGKPAAKESASTVANTSVAALAWFKSPAHQEQAKQAVKWLGTQRTSGGFGSADDTYLALRALEAHAEHGYRNSAAGEVKLNLGEVVVAEQSLTADRPGLVAMESLESRLSPGENRLKVASTASDPVAFGVEVRFYAAAPANDATLPLALETRFDADSVELEQLLKLRVEVTNRDAVARDYVTAEIGLPAGLEPNIDQLDVLRTQSQIDHYETRTRTIIPYWRRLEAAEVRRVEFDLKAVAPGQFTGPASNVFQLNEPQRRNWAAPLKVEVKQPTQPAP